MRWVLGYSALIVSCLACGSAMASGQGVVVDADTIAAARAASAADNTIDRLIEGVEVPGGKVALAALRRSDPETSGLVHSDVTEVYLITQGSGTIVIGGALADDAGTRSLDLVNLWAGPSFIGPHEEGETWSVGIGDVVVIPAGTAHRFSELEGVIEYLVFRFEGVP